MDNQDFALKFVDKIYRTLAVYQQALEIYERKVALYPQGRNVASEIAVTAKIDMLLEMFGWMKRELTSVELPRTEVYSELNNLVNTTPEQFEQILKLYVEELDEKAVVSAAAS